MTSYTPMEAEAALHHYRGNGADLRTQLRLCGQNCQDPVVLGQRLAATLRLISPLPEIATIAHGQWGCVPAPSPTAPSPKCLQRKGPSPPGWWVQGTEARDGLAPAVEIRLPSVVFSKSNMSVLTYSGAWRKGGKQDTDIITPTFLFAEG